MRWLWDKHELYIVICSHQWLQLVNIFVLWPFEGWIWPDLVLLQCSTSHIIESFSRVERNTELVQYLHQVGLMTPGIWYQHVHLLHGYGCSCIYACLTKYCLHACCHRQNVTSFGLLVKLWFVCVWMVKTWLAHSSHNLPQWWHFRTPTDCQSVVSQTILKVLRREWEINQRK